MKTKLVIVFLALWLAAPNRVANAETPPPPEKMAMQTLFVMGCVVAVVGAGVYVAVKIKKRFGGTNGLFNAERRFGTNLLSALSNTNVTMSSISAERDDVPYLLSLATTSESSGRYVLECTTNAADWFELGRYHDEDWISVHEAPVSGMAFYRVRVNP